MTKDSAHLCKLTGEQREFAATHLNETESTRLQRIQELKNWIFFNGEFSRMDDFFLLRFLRGCKFDVEKTKQKLRSYYEQRSLSPEWFINRDPFLPELQELLNLGVILPLKKTDDEGRMIVVIRACVHDPKIHRLSDVFKVGMMVIDLATREHVDSSLYGIVAVYDMIGVQFNHALQLTPGIVKRLVHTWQTYPNRIHSLEYVNAPSHVSIVLNIFKRFMSKKLGERMHVYQGDVRAIHKKLSPSVLPIELGGTEENYDYFKCYWKQHVEMNKQWFLDDEKYKLKMGK